ncbi:MAG: MBL fold metallo-hydrolase [Parvularculaceae bacterium]
MGIVRGSAALLAAVFSAISSCLAADPFEFEWTRLSDGVWAGVRPVSYNAPPTGTTLIVIGENGVLLFDPAGTPLVGERVLAKVADLTDLPVTHMVISHWHGDHSQGAYRILEKFPDAEIIAHEFTASAIRSPLNAFTPPDEAANEASRSRLKNALATGKRSNGDDVTPAMRAYFTNALDYFDLVDSEVRALKPIDPNRTFADALTIDLGGRRVELRHMGPGNTAGDVIAYLPAEKILATGDVVVRPTPYGFYSHPRSWIEVLKQLRTLPADYIVPGHGEIMTDMAYLDLLIDALSFVADNVDRLVKSGKTLDEVREALDWSAIEPRFTGDDALLALFFDGWFKTPIVEAEYKIAGGADSEPLDAPQSAASGK